MRKLYWALPLLASLLLYASPAEGAGEYSVVAEQVLHEGVVHRQLAGTGPRRSVHVAHVTADAPIRLKVVASLDRRQTARQMCTEAEAIACINGDFYLTEALHPKGAVITDGELQVSRRWPQPQLSITDKGMVAGDLKIAITLAVSSKLNPAEWLTAHDRQLELASMPPPTEPEYAWFDADAINVETGERLVYTPLFGQLTPSCQCTELVLSGRMPLVGAREAVELRARYSGGNTPIPLDGIVISGRGSQAAALDEIWEGFRPQKGYDRQAYVELATGPLAGNSLGVYPVLLEQGGMSHLTRTADSGFFKIRHPRTLLGWNADGEIWLVTVDGRQRGHSTGMSLQEAANFMALLGATDAVNLDGGGSTTFVAGGRVLNRPSDGAERAGPNIVAIIPADGVSAAGFEIEPLPSTGATALVPLALVFILAGWRLRRTF